jgi:thiol-disulfide isomerase/thioredoxin
MPALRALADFYGPQKLVVLAVNFKESNAKMTQYAASTGLSLPVLPDPGGDIARRWGANVFPTTVLIASDGQPRHRIRGELDWTGREAEALLQPLFKR